MGFSQGNLLIRGYIERYNTPPVKNFISVHGPLAGVGALPHCAPTSFICKQINAVGFLAFCTRLLKGRTRSSRLQPTRIPSRVLSTMLLVLAQ